MIDSCYFWIFWRMFFWIYLCLFLVGFLKWEINVLLNLWCYMERCLGFVYLLVNIDWCMLWMLFIIGGVMLVYCMLVVVNNGIVCWYCICYIDIWLFVGLIRNIFYFDWLVIGLSRGIFRFICLFSVLVIRVGGRGGRGMNGCFFWLVFLILFLRFYL